MPDDEQHPKRDQADKPEEKAADKRQETEKKDEGDKFRPDAIAARIEAIGEEDEADRIARQEEQKLLERKKGKKGGGKKGLESAASKRLAKIGEAKVKRPGALGTADVTPDADPLLERLARAGKWIREHRQTFGGLVAIGLLGAGGLFGWYYWQGKHEAEASAMLAQAIADGHGRVSDKDDDDDGTSKREGMYPTFKSASDRTAAALAKYRDVEAKYPGTGAAILARLSEGGLLLDTGDAKGALAAYGDVKASPLAQADVEVRGRAIEGTGFADELLARTDAGNKDKHLDEALSAYKDLEALDMKGFKELGQYHEARVQQAKGDKAKAIELLKGVHEKVSDVGETHPFSYLEFVVEDRLRELDPTALPAKSAMPRGPAGGAGAGPDGIDTSDPKIQELLKKFQEQMQQSGGGTPAIPGGGGGGGGTPGAPGMPPPLPPPSPPK
jgi:hypothetical protein